MEGELTCPTDMRELVVRIDERVGTIQEDVSDILVHAKNQNNRIDKLEGWKDKATGAMVLIGFLFSTGSVAFLIQRLSS